MTLHDTKIKNYIINHGSNLIKNAKVIITGNKHHVVAALNDLRSLASCICKFSVNSEGSVVNYNCNHVHQHGWKWSWTDAASCIHS